MGVLNAFFPGVLSYFSHFDSLKFYIIKLIHSVAQEYRSVLREFTFMLTSRKCIFSLFQPYIYTANWHLSARGVRRVKQTQHRLALNKWM